MIATDTKDMTTIDTSIGDAGMTVATIIIKTVGAITGLLYTGSACMSNHRSFMHHPVHRASVSFYHRCFLVPE